MIVIEIDAFFLNDWRKVADLGVNGSYVFAHDPQEEKLDRGKEEYANHQGCYADRKTVPEYQFIDKIKQCNKYAHQS